MGFLAAGGALFTDPRSCDGHIVTPQAFLRLGGLPLICESCNEEGAVLRGEDLPGVNQSFLSLVPSSTVAELAALYASAQGLSSSLLLQGRDCASVIFCVPRPWHRGHILYMIQKASWPQVLKSTIFWGVEGVGGSWGSSSKGSEPERRCLNCRAGWLWRSDHR